MDTPEQFYNTLAADYHLIFSNWENALARHGAVIDSLIEQYGKDKTARVLDCSCGIGTQSLGLAKLGYCVFGTDISAEEINRAKAEATKRNLDLPFAVADFRKLEDVVTELFDVVISFDNALPHMLTTKDLALALKSIYNRLNNNGLFMASIRNYDLIVKEKPRYLPPYVYQDGDVKRIALQVWDWQDDIYILNHYLILQNGENCTTKYAQAKYRAVTKKELTEQMALAGFKEVIWAEQEQTGYHQSILIGRK